jgi:hypothetical protein
MRNLSLVNELSSYLFKTRTYSKKSNYTGPIDNSRDLDSDITLVDIVDGSNDEDLA